MSLHFILPGEEPIRRPAKLSLKRYGGDAHIRANGLTLAVINSNGTLSIVAAAAANGLPEAGFQFDELGRIKVVG